MAHRPQATAERRDRASLLEAAITQLDSLDKLERVECLHTYGDTRDEQFFHVALELCITWVNRVLFLKLLEAQVVTYHGGSKAHTFLHSGRVRNYDDLNSLFFQVLARKPQERSTGMWSASATCLTSTAPSSSPPNWSTAPSSSATWRTSSPCPCTRPRCSGRLG